MREGCELVGENRTEKDFQSAVLNGEWMPRIYDSIVRNERFQVANFLEIAFSQSTTPNSRIV